MSIASLQRIAGALGIEVSDVFAYDGERRPRILRRDARPNVAWGSVGHKALLTPKPFHSVEVVVANVDPGGSTGDEPYTHGDSEEVFFVVSGAVELQLGGERFELAEGDTRSTAARRRIASGTAATCPRRSCSSSARRATDGSRDRRRAPRRHEAVRRRGRGRRRSTLPCIAASSSRCSGRRAAARRRRCADRRLRASRRGRAADRRRRRLSAAALPPRREHGLSVVRALPAPGRGAERGVRARAARAARSPRGERAREVLELVRLPRWPSARHDSSPAGSSSASRSRARS